MIAEIPIIISVINQIREFFKMSDAKTDAQKAEIKTALKSIYAASIETKNYLTERENGKERDAKIESGLSRLWVEAAIESRNIDMELARILEEKSRYWTEPENWTEEQIHRSGIGIDKVTNEARELLLNG